MGRAMRPMTRIQVCPGKKLSPTWSKTMLTMAMSFRAVPFRICQGLFFFIGSISSLLLWRTGRGNCGPRAVQARSSAASSSGVLVQYFTPQLSKLHCSM